MSDKKEKKAVKLTPEQKAKKKKTDKIFRIVGFALAGVQLVASIVLIVMFQYLNMLPTDYKLMLAILLVLFAVVTAITQKWKIPGIVTKVLAIILSVVMVVGCVYIGDTYKAVKNMSGNKVKVATIGVYVLSDDEAKELSDTSDYQYGIIKNIDRDNTDDTIKEINSKLDTEISYVELDDMVSVADSLLNGDTQAIIINESYIGVLSGMEGYYDIEDKVKCIYEYKIETVVEDDKNPDYLSSDDTFTMYISGVDVNGSPTENRNSDVNILCTVNTKTHQILMINTPRDFYVPTTVSGGAPDKLTHAGCSGIDCSVGTLEMLYGVNIDYYLKVNFTGFVEIINQLGGVDVYSEYEFTSYHGGYHFNVGTNHMNGEQALGFARERYAFGSGDRQRGKNQMAVIKAVINKMMSKDMLLNYSNILNAVSASMVTNMSYTEISDLVKMQIDTMPSWDIQSYSVNGSGDNLPCFSLSAPNYVMVPDQTTIDQAKQYLTDLYDDQKITVE